MSKPPRVIVAVVVAAVLAVLAVWAILALPRARGLPITRMQRWLLALAAQRYVEKFRAESAG